MKEEDKLTLIKDILLTDDREFSEKIAERIKLLEKTLSEQNQLAGKVNPIIAQRLQEFKDSIPDTLGSTITEALKREIKNSRDEVVDALYPILGKMIKKYVSQEVKVLSDRINDRLNWKKRFSNKFRKEKDLISKDIFPTKIEQVLLIEQKSGLLISSYSNTETIDEEMISGMLTAIKIFVEDAYLKKEQNLELIEYELFKIHIQSFVTHYIAVVISGNYDISIKDQLQNIIFDFYESFKIDTVESKKEVLDLDKKLIKYFSNVGI